MNDESWHDRVMRKQIELEQRNESDRATLQLLRSGLAEGPHGRDSSLELKDGVIAKAYGNNDCFNVSVEDGVIYVSSEHINVAEFENVDEALDWMAELAASIKANRKFSPRLRK